VTDREAVIFDTTGGGDHIYLGYLPNREESIAEAINNNNKIVGYAFNYIDGGSVYPSDEDIAAVLFDETGGGQNLYLGGLAGFENSKALAINDYDQIVGSCFGLNTNPLNMRATLFYAEGSNVDLNTVLVNPIEGWTLSEAVAINDDGWIVGSMYNTSFNQHAFLLKPVPEPATLSFMIIGFWAAANRRRILK
jgi:uncharacterized membrane protein